MKLRLFGVPTLVGAGVENGLVFTAERPFQLLAFLAFRRQWVRRDELAALLWPDRDANQARTNLRKVLLLARQLPGVGEIEQQRDLLRWIPDTDLRAFEEACDSGRFDEAASLFRAPLLEGMELGFPPESRDWIVFERERIEAAWHALCLRRLDAVASDAAESMRLAGQMLVRNRLDETAVCAMARAQLALGQRGAAIETLETYAARLASELAIEPTTAWHDTLRAINADAQPSAKRPVAVATARTIESFVGRRNELAQIRQLLAQPACRLLTLVGLAGTGKSALARRAISAGQCPHGDAAVWISLEDLTSASELPARMAAALGISLSGGDEPWVQIEHALAQRSMLLVLDSAEHLPIADELTHLLEGCDELKLLVTSRSRLHVKGEWLLPVDGLPVPDEDEAEIDALRSCDAIRLFEARALPFMPSFDLASQAAEVAELVRLVGGSPLAIELSAAWTRVMPVADIVVELGRSLDLLESAAPAERGLRAGFDQAWQRLAESERAVLAALALLPGDFGRAMATQVVSASLPVLAALVDKALLRCDDRGRFSMHPLIRQRACLHAADRDRVLSDHAHYIASWIVRYGDAWRDMGRAVLTEMDAELAHLRAAWKWAVEHRDARLVTAMARALGTYYENRGLWQEGVAAFASAEEAFRASERLGREHVLAFAAAMRALQTLQYRSGKLLDAESTARRLLQRSHGLSDSSFLKASLNTIGLCLWQQGKFAEARPFFAQAREIADNEGRMDERARFDANLALVDKAQGRYSQALEAYFAALDVNRSYGQFANIVTTLNNIANIYRVQQRFEDALGCLDEALTVCTRERLAAARPFVLVNLGLAHDELGHAEEAATWFQQALDESRANGEPIIEAATLLGQAHQDAVARRFDAARAKVAAALAIADGLPSAAVQVQCVLSYGEIAAAEGDIELGASLMRWGIEQRALNRADRDVAQRKLERLRSAGRRTIPPDRSLREVLALVSRGE